jgi:hypothetical protein
MTAAALVPTRVEQTQIQTNQTYLFRSTEMYTMNEDLARAHMSARLGEARQMRAGREMARARRLSRKAERAAQQARLALARAL